MSHAGGSSSGPIAAHVQQSSTSVQSPSMLHSPAGSPPVELLSLLVASGPVDALVVSPVPELSRPVLLGSVDAVVSTVVAVMSVDALVDAVVVVVGPLGSPLVDPALALGSVASDCGTPSSEQASCNAIDSDTEIRKRM